MNEDFAAILRRHLKHLGPHQELAMDAPLRDLGLDSLAAVSLIFDLEDEFGLTFPDSSLVAGTFRTPRTLWAAVAATGNGGSG